MNDRFGYQPTTKVSHPAPPPKDPYGAGTATASNVDEDFQLSLRKDNIFKAILASRVYGDARTHERGMERVFEMFNKYFEEN